MNKKLTVEQNDDTMTVSFDEGTEFDKIPYCVDCKYYEEVYNDYCRHNQFQLFCLVTGEPYYTGKALNPFKARKKERLCGEYGKWFEAKKDNKKQGFINELNSVLVKHKWRISSTEQSNNNCLTIKCDRLIK